MVVRKRNRRVRLDLRVINTMHVFALALASFTVRNLPVVGSFRPRVHKCADYSWHLEGIRTS